MLPTHKISAHSVHPFGRLWVTYIQIFCFIIKIDVFRKKTVSTLANWSVCVFTAQLMEFMSIQIPT